jgi:hypothetical protein
MRMKGEDKKVDVKKIVEGFKEFLDQRGENKFHGGDYPD